MNLIPILQRIKVHGITPELKAKISKQELVLLQKILEELEEYGRSDILESLWEYDYETRPVDIDEFLDNEYYLGKIGRDIYPIWRKDLRHVLNPLSPKGEWIIKGSIGCVTGDTKVPLLDGTTPTIKDLVGRDEFWVYSVNRDNSRIEGARGFNARKTGSNVKVFKVTLDNGEVVRATPDHRFMMRDGSYERLEDLKPGDSLMPLYRVQESIGRGKALYDKFLDLSGSWVWTHRRIAQQKYGPRYWSRSGGPWQIHHADLKSLNNRPDNLELLTKVDHFKRHASYARHQLQAWRDSFPSREAHVDALRPRLLKGVHTRWNGPDGDANRAIASLSTSIRMMDGQAASMAKKSWENPERRSRHTSYMEEFNSKRHPKLRSDITPEKLMDACLFVASIDGTMSDVAKYLGCSRERCYKVCSKQLKLSFTEVWAACGGALRTNSRRTGKNHKIVSIEFDGYEDVYDIEVEGTANYATDAGVFIHNSGKTFVAVAAVIYKIYRLLCLKDPQRFHGLASGSPVVFGLFNIFKYLAGATSYQYLTTWLRDMSPFFAQQRGDHLASSKKKQLTDKAVLNLPKNISIALGAAAIHALGQNIFGGILDETEFGKAKSITSDEKSQISDLYHNVRTRMDSRFMQKGGINPGLLCLVSSARDHEQFLSKHVKRKEGIESAHISQYALYEVKEHVYRDSERFTVVVGDKLHRSYILDDNPDKTIREGARVVHVPREFYEAFDYDIDTSIRDICGIETYGTTLFFPRRDLLLEATAESTPRKHPFKQEEITLSIDDSYYIEDYLDKDQLLDHWDRSNNLYRPKYFAYADRYIHVDLAKNRDAAGMAMVCVSEEKDIRRVSNEGLMVKARDYVFFLDLALRIRASQGSEIDFAKIRQFIFFLMDTCNFKVRWVSYDSFQSTDSIQIFKKEGVQARELSMDRSPGPYRAFRSILMEKRMDTYHYNPFFDEVTKLEDNTSSDDGKRIKGKVDHPVGGSKDVSDAICGAITGALLSKGHQVTGSVADRIKDRASVYKSQMTERMQPEQDPTWITRGARKINPLDKLFEE